MRFLAYFQVWKKLCSYAIISASMVICVFIFLPNLTIYDFAKPNASLFVRN